MLQQSNMKPWSFLLYASDKHVILENGGEFYEYMAHGISTRCIFSSE